MPELPEVETMVRGIRPHVAGRIIRYFRTCRTRCKPITVSPSAAAMGRRITGQSISLVRRIAKRVVLDLSDGSHVVIEPRMTGLMLLADPPDPEHLRLEWGLDGCHEYASLWFLDRRGLGTVRYYRPDELAVALGPDRLGPDALTAAVEDWQHLCSRTRRAIKVAMLDQKLIAGIGNLYASEILHLARVHPQIPAAKLRVPQIAAIAVATNHVLSEAIRYEGSTLSDGTYRNALNRDGGYQNAHRVYDREGEQCRTCAHAIIVRIVQGQRSTFFCPQCQQKHRMR
ncbi:MAG: bifunctional DNA-formamidopyrimidine glycosylase/DNA-(apurinic or apyrimidinic site) lyase [Planctomycetaceae bacterium]|nr:bifunctional DNA-formamidopyrimidine glycosylase/DNA-(apurinic or apyrimidinic site) lyase [Planctomycetaceae bacterium]